MSDTTPNHAAPCSHCDGETLAGANYCHHCGEPLYAGGMRKGRIARTVAWLASIAAVIAVVALATVLLTGQDRGGAVATGEFPVFPGLDRRSATPRPPDLSQMTPRQAADRLFNRVMMASEQGKVEEAKRFAPMAIQAYGGLERLDADAHYHLGLIHAVLGDYVRVRSEIGILRQSAPDHLLAFILEHKAAQAAGDGEAAGRAQVAFFAAYDEEIKAPRPEYAAHRGTIEKFRTEAAGR